MSLRPNLVRAATELGPAAAIIQVHNLCGIGGHNVDSMLA